MRKGYDTSTLASIEALNAHVGRGPIMWPFYRDEFLARGGREGMAAQVTAKVVAQFPDCVTWREYIGTGGALGWRIEVMKPIKVGGA